MEGGSAEKESVETLEEVEKRERYSLKLKYEPLR